MNAPTHRRERPRRAAREPAGRWRVLLACAAWWGGALLLVSRFPQVESAGIRLTLVSVRAALAALGRSVLQTGETLSVGMTSLRIGADCSPHLPFLIFAGAVLAMRASWRQRALGLVLGALAIHVFNVARILTLFAVQAARPEWFDFVHVYLWQVGTIVAVVAAFTSWLAWTGRPARAA